MELVTCRKIAKKKLNEMRKCAIISLKKMLMCGGGGLHALVGGHEKLLDDRTEGAERDKRTMMVSIYMF